MSQTIAAVREYWDKQPCNIHHSREPIGTKEYFNQVAQRKYIVEPHIPGFADFKSWSGKSVLEIGCGIGTDAVNFASCGASYTGLDISEKSLELSRLRFYQRGLTGQFFLGNAEQLAEIVPRQKFDLVYSFGVIHHTPNPQAVVDAVMGYMHSESEFRLMLYARDSWKAIMIEAGLDQPEAQPGCPIARTFTRLDVDFLLRRYHILRLEQTHIFPYVVEDYVNHYYQVQPWFKVMPAKMFAALENRLGWHLLITAQLRSGTVALSEAQS